MESARKTILDNLKGIAQVIAGTYGRSCEVIIHDLSDLARSVVYVAGNVTGRELGAPATDLLINSLRKEGNQAQDMVGYRSVTRDGRVLKSSTAFIRDEKGEIFATLCMNYDVTDLLNANSAILNFAQINLHNEGKSETFAATVQETIESLVNGAIQILGKQPSTMAMKDKVRLVALLEERGAFLIKGAVEYIATVLGVSKFSVYNYLNKVRLTTEQNHSHSKMI